MTSYDLQGEVAVVTGGSRGIGAATAREFAKRGARVIIVHGSSPDDAEAVVRSLPGSGHRAVQASVTDTGTLADLAKEIRRRERRLTYLVNNAAWTKAIAHDQLDDLTDEIFERIFEVNTYGVFRCARALAPIIRETGGGAVVNISSVAARQGLGSNIAYCASKAAVESLTQTLARVFSPEVRVLAVAPGLTATRLVTMWSEDELTRRANANALKRMATPEEIARTVVAAAVDLTFSTGSVILADGGRALY